MMLFPTTKVFIWPRFYSFISSLCVIFPSYSQSDPPSLLQLFSTRVRRRCRRPGELGVRGLHGNLPLTHQHRRQTLRRPFRPQDVQRHRLGKEQCLHWACSVTGTTAGMNASLDVNYAASKSPLPWILKPEQQNPKVAFLPFQAQDIISLFRSSRSPQRRRPRFTIP